MLEEIYTFSKGILAFDFQIPIPLQIVAYFVVLLIITGLVYVLKDSLNLGPYRDTYMWYYLIAVFNILNICGVLYYYYTKNGSYVGEGGVTGYAGSPGKRGNNISCNLCTQNIYLQKTQGYDMITELNFVRLADVLVGQDLSQSLSMMNEVMGPERAAFFDFSELGRNLSAGTFDFNNPVVNNLLLLSTYADYPLIQYINQVLGLSEPGGQAGALFRPAKKVGNFAIGDIAFGGNEKFAVSAFMANGDIRCPQGFEPICSFVTAKGEEGELEYYNIYRMVPPVLTREDIMATRNINDISRKVENDRYVSLGHVAYFQKPAGFEPADPLLFACVKESCCQKVSSSNMRFICVYPGVSGGSMAPKATVYIPKPPTSNVPEDGSEQTETTQPQTKLSDITQKRESSEGYFSIWRTPMNTMVVKFSNTSYEDGLFLPEIMYENSDSIYEDDGTIKKKIRTKINAFLSRVKLDPVIVAVCIFGATIEKVKQDLKQFYDRFCSGPDPEILGTPALNNARDSKMTASDVSTALADIQKAIDDSKKPKTRTDENRRDLTSLFGGAESSQRASNLGNISYNARKMFSDIKKSIGRMTARIENAKNLWDVLIAVLPQGLDSRIYKADLTPTQARIIDLITVLVPPIDDVYMIKDECLVLEKLDKTRMEWESALEEEIGLHNKLVREANLPIDAGNAGETKDACNDVDDIIAAVDEGARIITNQIGHISDYMGKLSRAEFAEITDGQIRIIVGTLRKVNDYLRANCKLKS